MGLKFPREAMTAGCRTFFGTRDSRRKRAPLTSIPKNLTAARVFRMRVGGQGDAEQEKGRQIFQDGRAEGGRRCSAAEHSHAHGVPGDRVDDPIARANQWAHAAQTTCRIRTRSAMILSSGLQGTFQPKKHYEQARRRTCVRRTQGAPMSARKRESVSCAKGNRRERGSL